MVRRPLLVVLLVLVAATRASAARTRARAEDLLQVVSPVSRGVASAHPFVNVIVAFGTTPDGTRADPTTFRARRGRDDITDLFQPIVQNGIVTGMRAAYPPRLVNLGQRPRNRLRLSVAAERSPGAKGRRVRDVDRLRFGAEEQPNQSPTAVIAADADIVLPGVP